MQSPRRKDIRLKNYNYAKEGMYFITICTKNRRNILSNIIYEINYSNEKKSVGVAALGDPKIELSYIGKIVDQHIIKINEIYNNISVDCYIIMPNHVHFIIYIKNKGSPKAATPTISSVINSLKGIITKKCKFPIWQRNYYEHIIRNEKEYLEILEYIQNNPLKWKEDKYYKKGGFLNENTRRN